MRSECFEREHGVALVESALVVFCLLFVAMTFVDFARYYATQALLLKGAQDAVDMATKVSGFDVDTRTLKASVATDAAKVTRVRDLRAQLGDFAIRLARQSLLNAEDDPGKALTTAKGFQISEVLSDSTSAALTVRALVLRPGESGQRTDGTWVDHPLKCAPNSPTCPDAKKRQPNETMIGLLRAFPMFVRVEADVTPVSPWFGTMPVRVNTFAWREIPATSGFREGSSGSDTLPDGSPFPDPVDPRTGDGGGGTCTTTAGMCAAANLCLRDCLCQPCCITAADPFAFCAARNQQYDGWCLCFSTGF